MKTIISLPLLHESNLIFAWLLWTLPCQACAFYSPDLFMTDRGVSYYGAYVCTAHSFPVIKTRGCHPRDYSAADQRCWQEPKHALGEAARDAPEQANANQHIFSSQGSMESIHICQF